MTGNRELHHSNAWIMICELILENMIQKQCSAAEYNLLLGGFIRRGSRICDLHGKLVVRVNKFSHSSGNPLNWKEDPPGFFFYKILFSLFVTEIKDPQPTVPMHPTKVNSLTRIWFLEVLKQHKLFRHLLYKSSTLFLL